MMTRIDGARASPRPEQLLRQVREGPGLSPVPVRESPGDPTGRHLRAVPRHGD